MSQTTANAKSPGRAYMAPPGLPLLGLHVVMIDSDKRNLWCYGSIVNRYKNDGDVPMKAAKGRNLPRLDTLDRLQMFQRLNRHWRPGLTPAERDLLLYLMDDLSVGWGRLFGSFTYGQLMAGSVGEDGQWRCHPVGLSESTIKRAVKGLQEKGVVAFRFDGHRTRFNIDPQWMPEGEFMRVPKRLLAPADDGLDARTLAGPDLDQGLDQDPEGAQFDRTGGSDRPDRAVNLAGQVGQFDPPYNYSLNDIANGSYRVRTRTGSPARNTSQPELKFETTAEAIRHAHDKTNDARARKRQRLAATGSAAEHRLAWEDAWRETYPKTVVCVPWGGKDYGLVGTLAKRWHGDLGRFPLFLDFTVRNWRKVIARHFGWMTEREPPRYPALSFLSVFLERFVEAWCEKETYHWLRSLPGEEQAYATLVAEGASHDEAVLKIAERRALAADREQREKDKAEVQRMWRMVKRKEAALGATRFTADNPHPRAEENLPFRPAAPLRDYYGEAEGGSRGGSPLPALPDFDED